ncbi:MAG: PKD domain-containing protein [Gammaproteobacteria bacterium]|nr:PKD domain-containing protein [Gammaproteobacteria bacterium]
MKTLSFAITGFIFALFAGAWVPAHAQTYVGHYEATVGAAPPRIPEPVFISGTYVFDNLTPTGAVLCDDPGEQEFGPCFYELISHTVTIDGQEFESIVHDQSILVRNNSPVGVLGGPATSDRYQVAGGYLAGEGPIFNLGGPDLRLNAFGPGFDKAADVVSDPLTSAALPTSTEDLDGFPQFQRIAFINVSNPDGGSPGSVQGPLTSFSLGPAPSSQVTYDFEDLSPGALVGQDNWSVFSGASLQVGVGSGSNLTQVAANPGSSSGLNLMIRTNDGSFSLPAFSGLENDVFFEVDLQVDRTATQVMIFYVQGATNTAKISPWIGVNAAQKFTFRQATGATQTVVSIPASIDAGDWVRLRLEMDFTANAGAGIGDVSYRNLTDGDTAFTPVAGLQNLDLLLSPNADPAAWDRMVLRYDGAHPAAVIDNLTVSVGNMNLAPTADAGPDQAIRAGDTVFLNGTASFDDNTASPALVYAWSFVSKPAGSNAVLSDVAHPEPDFLADLSGTYVVELVVTDEAGLPSAADQVQVSSDNLAPTAVAGNNQLVVTGTEVVLDGSDSSDPENDSLTYLWTLGPAPVGSLATLSTPDLVTAGLTPDIEGLYVVTLEVSDFIGPGIPDSLEITATTAEDFAEIQIESSGESVEVLDTAQVTTGGNQTAFINFLSQAMLAIQEEDPTEAIQKLEKSIARTDGCALRGAPDGNGPGRDWITDCTEQQQVYTLLTDALEALLQ